MQGRSKIQITSTGAGASNQSTSQDKDFFGGGLVGYNLADGVSVEAEGVYSRNNLTYSPANAVYGIGGATRTYGGLGNLKFSLPFTPTYTVPLGFMTLPIGIKPYIAGGIGYGNVQFSGRNNATSYYEDQNGFIWQGKAGVEFRTGNHFGLDIGYRYPPVTRIPLSRIFQQHQLYRTDAISRPSCDGGNKVLLLKSARQKKAQRLPQSAEHQAAGLSRQRRPGPPTSLVGHRTPWRGEASAPSIFLRGGCRGSA